MPSPGFLVHEAAPETEIQTEASVETASPELSWIVEVHFREVVFVALVLQGPGVNGSGGQSVQLDAVRVARFSIRIALDRIADVLGVEEIQDLHVVDVAHHLAWSAALEARREKSLAYTSKRSTVQVGHRSDPDCSPQSSLPDKRVRMCAGFGLPYINCASTSFSSA